MIATLAAGAAAGRVLFAAVPGVQPVTVIAIVAGASLGARAGVATGALAAFVSNLFLGQGIWTPQQMLGWGACGAVGALLAPACATAGRSPRSPRCSASRSARAWTCGSGTGFSPHTFAALAAVLGRGALVRRVARDRERGDRARRGAGAAADARPLRRAPADGGRVGLARLPRSARRSRSRRSRSCSRTRRTVRSPRAERNRRCARSPRGRCSACAPPARDVARLARLPAGAGADAADSERHLARRARRAGARRATGRTARAPAGEARPSGQIGETLNSTFWARARARPLDAGDDALHPGAADEGGGFAWYLHGQADSNDTAAALEALRVAGVHGAPVTRAVRFLLHVPEQATAASS